MYYSSTVYTVQNTWQVLTKWQCQWLSPSPVTDKPQAYIILKVPNTPFRISDLLENSAASCCKSKLSSTSWLTWLTMTAFSQGSFIVLRSHVFSLRRALNERSAVHDETGHTNINRSNCSTAENIPRTSGTIFLKMPRTRSIQKENYSP